MATIAQIQTAAQKRAPCPGARTRETVFCGLLPSEDGEDWGREVTFRRLNVHDQIALTGRVVEAIQALSTDGETKTAFVERYGVPELDTPRARNLL